MNIAFYVSGKSSRVIKILGDKRVSNIKETIKFIFSDNIQQENIRSKIDDIPVYGIQFDSIESNTVSKNEELSNCLLSKLKKHQIDYCFSFG